jgi:acyl-CoA hydrolase
MKLLVNLFLATIKTLLILKALIETKLKKSLLPSNLITSVPFNPSVTNKGISRIVPLLKQGAGVVTTRGHIHWVVTEYGAVNLFGMNMDQRAKALIKIAHPSHRESLERASYERFKQ